MLRSTESAPMATVSGEHVRTQDPSKASFQLPKAFDRPRQHAREIPSLRCRMCWDAQSPSTEWLQHREDSVAATSRAQAARGREQTRMQRREGDCLERLQGEEASSCGDPDSETRKLCHSQEHPW